MAELQQHIESEFKERWGWIDLAMSVAKESLTPYFELIKQPALAVIALAGYLTDKVKIIESRYKKG